MAAAYGEVPQQDDDDYRSYGPSPSMSLSPAHSSSPMPFLPAVESTFTPLSMDSDSYSRVGVGVGVGVGAAGGEIAENNSHDKASHKKVGSTATTRTSVGISTMVQSLLPTRATHNSRSEYGLLSPEPSSPSTSPNPNTNRNNTNSSPYPRLATADNLSSRNAGTHPPSPNATGGSIAGESKVKESSSRHQPVLVKPIPIVRAASTKSVSLRHPTPDSNTRSSSHVTNIAQLEATAEKLSMTSSIEDAIRDLHEEQKRNDSRRSSILAASIGSIPEDNEPASFLIPKPLSTASSILETNNAARYGGYSPAGFIMSPNPSLLSNPTRLRSGSGTLSAAESEVGGVMSRHGPGKSSVRSVRSASKPTLTDIAEMEPTTLTPAAMDAADRLAEEPEEEALQIPQMEDIDLTPNAERYGTSSGYDYWDQAVAEARQGDKHDGRDDRPPTAGSTGTYEQAEKAFADFDGAHCPSDVDPEESQFIPSLTNGPSTDTPFLQPFDYDPSKGEEDTDHSRPVISRPIGPPTVRPKSYMDPETGQTMLFYPARVPLMLNLPQKLSKKPKAEARNARRSQVLEKMTETNRQSGATWLPEFLSDPPDPIGLHSEQATPLAATGLDAELRIPLTSEGQHQSQFQPQLDQGAMNEDAPKSRMSMIDLDKRKSRLDGLPPQLRASAFFDLPSELPTVQLKDGSAMATLDSILDASAKAPVSAFTDHAFAGTLGSEVYGTEKKRRSHMKSSSTTDLLEPKKRSSFLHLRKPSALSRHSISQEEQRNASLAGTRMDEALDNNEQDERQRLSSSVDGQPVLEQDKDDEGEEEELLYDGPPTTLLAELQIRKQQQKLRTRPVATAFPNGLHSTLLEMDTVAQIERNTRKGKKINLAWEDPNADPTNDSEDEDTPLGLLMAAKGQGNDMTATMAEIHRPLGLMERRDMEDNEPLSHRRDRLQGREAGLMKRQSMLTLGQGLHKTNNASGSLRAPSLQLRVHTPEEDEVEGETLGERMRRLKAREQDNNPLPQARPVSSAFSAELLSQIGDAYREDKSDEKSQDNQKFQPKEEEETLGQRRRRLQAERDARDGRLAGTIPTSSAAGDVTKLTKRHSLADVLGARNGSRAILSDPRAEADRAKQEEAARYRQNQEQKMAALRNQMPSSLSTPNLNRPGGYMAGRFNDGAGGGIGIGHLRTSTALGGYPSQSTGTGMMNNGMVANAYGTGGTGGSQLPYGVPNGYGAQMNNPYGMQLQPPGQMDRVERWRQSILP
ncbi:hypothetical protein F4818DRAFT_419 [Hypoxylon cercidicola]|nr:hypothetical protein F4818DRAFT_419 [Hypoxylon cercidicola]